MGLFVTVTGVHTKNLYVHKRYRNLPFPVKMRVVTEKLNTRSKQWDVKLEYNGKTYYAMPLAIKKNGLDI